MIRSTALVVAALALVAASSRAEVDVEVPSSFSTKGSLADGTAVYRFFAPAGTVCDLKAAVLKKAPLSLDVRLFDPVDAQVGPAAVGTKVQSNDLLLVSSGEYRLEVAGTGTGDYSLSVKCKPETTFAGTLDIAADGFGLLPFSAARGSTVKFTSKPSPGSGAVPALQSVSTPGNSVPLTETVKGTTHTATLSLPVLQGDFNLVVHNTGPAGMSAVSAKVKPAKAKPTKLDLRGAVLGRPAGEETFVGAFVDQAGGTVTVQDAGSDLFGAEVVVPAGSLFDRTTVSIASTVALPAPSEDEQAAGPAVDLQPSGTQFIVPVTVTLPFDLSKVPANASPQDIRILIVEDSGESVVVDPSTVDEMNGVVTVETSGFSVCIPIIVSGPPRLGLAPGGDEYWFLQFGAEILVGGGNDSRNRNLRNGIGEISFFGDGTMQFSQDSHEYDWQNSDSPPMSGQPFQSNLSESVGPEGGTLNWAYDGSGRNIVLSGIPEPLPTFRVSRDGRYMAGRQDGSVETFTEALFVVKKNTAPLTTASLDGTWNFVFLETDAGQDSATGAAHAQPARATGTVVFDGEGGCRISLTDRSAEFDSDSGTFSQRSEGQSFVATYAIDGTVVPGTILVTLPADGEDPAQDLRVHPGPGLDVMLLTHASALGNGGLGMVLTRQGTNLGPASLDGPYHGASFGLDLQSYSPGAGGFHIGDFSTTDEGVAAGFDGTNTVSIDFDRHEVHRNGSEPNGVLVGNELDTFPVAVALTKQGKLTLTASEGKVQGVAAPDGQLLAFISDMGDATGSFEFYFMFRSPPLP